jgi:hypothetical protein
MRLSDLMAEIEPPSKATGYRVHFEKRAGGMLSSDYAPDRTEDAIPLEADAWALATRLAFADPHGKRFVNIYVIHAHDWTPVANYTRLMLNAHPRPTKMGVA